MTGDRLLSELTSLLSRQKDEVIPRTFFTGWFELARYYNKSGRCDEATQLAKAIQRNIDQFDQGEDISQICEGIVIDALRRSGKATEACLLAVKLLGESEIETPQYRGGPVDHRDIWVTAARSFSAVRNYSKAIPAYSTAALSFGGLCAEAQFSRTSSERLYWISHQSRIVHELVALWLTIPTGTVRDATEKCAANALLKSKFLHSDCPISLRPAVQDDARVDRA